MRKLESPDPGGSVSLADLVNRIVDRGVVVSGEVIVSVADVDLLYLNLNLLLAGTETLRRRGGAREEGGGAESGDPSEAPALGEGVD